MGRCTDFLWRKSRGEKRSVSSGDVARQLQSEAGRQLRRVGVQDCCSAMRRRARSWLDQHSLELSQTAFTVEEFGRPSHLADLHAAAREIHGPLASGARGREFKSPRSDQLNQSLKFMLNPGLGVKQYSGRRTSLQRRGYPQELTFPASPCHTVSSWPVRNALQQTTCKAVGRVQDGIIEGLGPRTHKT